MKCIGFLVVLAVVFTVCVQAGKPIEEEEFTVFDPAVITSDPSVKTMMYYVEGHKLMMAGYTDDVCKEEKHKGEITDLNECRLPNEGDYSYTLIHVEDEEKFYKDLIDLSMKSTDAEKELNNYENEDQRRLKCVVYSGSSCGAGEKNPKSEIKSCKVVNPDEDTRSYVIRKCATDINETIHAKDVAYQAFSEDDTVTAILENQEKELQLSMKQMKKTKVMYKIARSN
eukprot:Nk52_evm14s485 gene=Nk52_evmTU14s485